VEEQRVEVIDVDGGTAVSLGSSLGRGLPTDVIPPLARCLSRLGDHRVDQDQEFHLAVAAGQRCTEPTEGWAATVTGPSSVAAATTMASRYSSRPAVGSAPGRSTARA
jgi:hypothetical protein